MHKRIVASIIARFLLVISMIMFIPLSWAYYDDHGSMETRAFIITILLGIIGGLILFKIFNLQKDDFKRINTKDGLAVVSLSWICLSAFGALPLFLSGVTPTYTDAFFEIASGFTTTGATIFTDIESLPRGILFWRSLTHWLGGMGIIVLYIALLPALGINSFQLYKAEAPGLTVERVDPRLKKTANSLWGVYFLLTILQVLFLYGGGMPWFDAFCHTFGTIATGGFSTQNASISAYGPYIQWVIIVFMFLAGTNFILHYQAFRGRVINYLRNEEFRWYLFIVLFLTLVFSLVLFKTKTSVDPIRESAFQVVSMLTTTGYTSADFEIWPFALKFILVILMIIGGCGSSTGGGMKLIRIILSIKIAFYSVLQAVFPNAVLPIKFNGKAMLDSTTKGILSYFVIFILLLFFGAATFIMLENCDIVTGLTASISALSNIGPGLGEIGATKNFAWISIPGKWLLTFLMLAGRLELYAILILFVPATWKK